ncbi:unnamed protein product [Ilex paraguariensis]|uniref:Pentatricopeptide repeat-containing protein n=1 Tax=Ilex paraguariensis TaxID=185542 RepID=A0ABC8RVY8_9AQUA
MRFFIEEAIPLETTECTDETITQLLTLEPPEESGKDSVEELLLKSDDVSRLMKMERRSDLDSKDQFNQSRRWFPYLDKFDAGSMHLSGGEVLETLDRPIGQSDELLRLYSYVRHQTVGIRSSAILFGLKSCIELGDLEFGRGIHTDALKFGLNISKFVGSSLIGLYSRCGDIEEAAKAFDEIIEKDIVAYTSLITGYAQVGDHRAYEAFRVAYHMQKEEIDPNRVTLVSLLQAASELGALEEGQSIHGYAIRRGIGCSDEVFETSLMDMYNKCGPPNMAATFFARMGSRTVGSWNALISRHLQLGQPLEALHLFFQMVQRNYELDLITLANGLLSCADLENLLVGKIIHAYIVRTGAQLDIVATTALIDMYLKCNHLILAREIFDRIEEKDVISFNVMIAGYLQNGFACQAIEVFYEMVGIGIRLNPVTIMSILSALSDLKDVRQGKCIHGYVFRRGFGSNTEIANQIIYMYTKCGFVQCASRIFKNIKRKDLVSWTSMMMGYLHQGHADEAVTLFRLMQRENLSPDSVTLICLLQAFAQLGFLNLAKEVHCLVQRVSLDIGIPVINSLITAYSKCGKLDMSRVLFEHMAGRCLVSWNTMIAAYGMHGRCVQALKLFDQMKKENVVPDDLTFRSVLAACSHSGLVEEGLHIFRSMKEEYSMIPSEEHYGCMIDLLSRAGRLEEAYDLLRCLPPRQSASALGALLAACRVHGNSEMGETVGRWLLDLEPQNPSTYGLVSNIYAGGEKWKEAAQVRALAKERSLKRTPGYSLIEFR